MHKAMGLLLYSEHTSIGTSIGAVTWSALGSTIHVSDCIVMYHAVPSVQDRRCRVTYVLTILQESPLRKESLHRKRVSC
eukprot:SAG31_NODE_2357_length_5874_cov_4.759827_4_plen_79_part_00